VIGPHFIFVPGELEQVDPTTGKRETRIADYCYPECDLIGNRTTIPGKHMKKYCFGDYRRCIEQRIYEKWWELER
jgi:hypothetical protein